MSVTITSLVRGETAPPVRTGEKKMMNIDFKIVGDEAATHIGDGSDEYTEWIFDFSLHPVYPSFSILRDLKFARLTLMVEPKNILITTDVVEIVGLHHISTPLIQTLPVDGRIHTVTINLLDYYCSASILEILSTHSGKIKMKYQDDAIVSYAHLELAHAC